MKRLGLFLFMLSLLAGCSVLLSAPAPADTVYRLAPVTPRWEQPVPVSVYVPALTVTAALDSTRIVLFKPNFQQDFVAHSRWAETLPVYLHAVIVDSLSRSGAVQTLTTQPLAQQGYTLQLRVTDFQAEYPAPAQDTLKVVVGLEATLLRSRNQQVVMQQRYRLTQAPVAARTSAIVAALNHALGQVLTQLGGDLRQRLR